MNKNEKKNNNLGHIYIKHNNKLNLFSTHS